jgi:hypothetical protein
MNSHGRRPLAIYVQKLREDFPLGPDAVPLLGSSRGQTGAIALNPGLVRRADKIKPAYLGYSFLIEATLICRQAIGRAEPHSPKTMDNETE